MCWAESTAKLSSSWALVGALTYIKKKFIFKLGAGNEGFKLEAVYLFFAE